MQVLQSGRLKEAQALQKAAANERNAIKKDLLKKDLPPA